MECAFLLVAADPFYLPSREQQTAAMAFFQEVAPPPCDSYRQHAHESVQFFAAGSGLARATCPHCRNWLSLYENGVEGHFYPSWVLQFRQVLDQWLNGQRIGLEDAVLHMPCCESQARLLSLEFHMPSYFAKFALYAYEPSRSRFWEGDIDDYMVGEGTLRPETLDRFKQILGCPVKQMWVLEA